MSEGIFLILDPALKAGESLGHYNEYAENVRKGVPTNWKCMAAGFQSIDSKQPSKFIASIYSHDIWGKDGKSKDALDMGQSNLLFFDESKLALCKMLDRNEIDSSTNFKIVIFMPNLTPFNYLGFVELAEEFADFSFVGLLRYQPLIFTYNLGNRFTDKLLPNNLSFVTDSDELAEEYQEFIDSVVNVGIPVTSENGPVRTSQKNFRISTFGNARKEKGTDLIISVAQLAYSKFPHLPIEFSIQVNDPCHELETKVTELLKARSENISLISTSLNSDEYRERLEKTDLVCLPYDQSIYRSRTSGILMDCILKGKPAVVSEGTWLSRQVERFGSGLAVSRDPELILEAAVEILLDYENFQRSCVLAQRHFQEICDPKNFFSRLESVWQKQTKKKCLIFVPWGVESLRGSGIGHRLGQIREFLNAINVNSEVIISRYWDGSKFLDNEKGLYEIPFSLGKSENVHLALHSGEFEPIFYEFIDKKVSESDAIIFLGTHLVQQIVDEFHVTKEIFIESADALGRYYGIPELSEAEIESLKLGNSFNVSREETEYFKESTEITFSNIQIKSKYMLKKEDALIITRCSLPVLRNKQFLLFVGSDYGPNHDAVDFLLKSADYLAERDIPLVIVGSVMPKNISKNVICLGQISQFMLECLMKSTSLFLNPMFEGSGISIKTLEALANGAKVYATKLGARDLHDLNYPQLIIEDWNRSQYSEYADAILRLLESGSNPQLVEDSNDKDNLINAIGIFFGASTMPSQTKVSLKEVLDLILEFSIPPSVYLSLIGQLKLEHAFLSLTDNLKFSIINLLNNRITLVQIFSCVTAKSIVEYELGLSKTTWRDFSVQLREELIFGLLDLIRSEKIVIQEVFESFRAQVELQASNLKKSSMPPTENRLEKRDVFVRDVVLYFLSKKSRYHLNFRKFSRKRRMRSLLLWLLGIRLKPRIFFVWLLSRLEIRIHE